MIKISAIIVLIRSNLITRFLDNKQQHWKQQQQQYCNNDNDNNNTSLIIDTILTKL